MVLSRKYLFAAILIGFISYQLYLIVTEFSSTRIIQVQKEIYEGDEKDYLKKYDIVNAPFEQFDIKVSPTTVLDYLLLTNNEENLFTLILKIVAGVLGLIYIYKLGHGNLFEIKIMNWARFSIIMIALSYLVLSFGLDHTKDFWKSIYSSQSKIDFWKYEFYINTKNNFLLYFWAIIYMVGFMDSVVEYNKPATIDITQEKYNI
jgi:hypothetical protein